MPGFGLLASGLVLSALALWFQLQSEKLKSQSKIVDGSNEVTEKKDNDEDKETKTKTEKKLKDSGDKATEKKTEKKQKDSGDKETETKAEKKQSDKETEKKGEEKSSLPFVQPPEVFRSVQSRSVIQCSDRQSILSTSSLIWPSYTIRATI